MAEIFVSEKRGLEIAIEAVREYYERKYKLYKANNDLPVTDEEFENLRKKSSEVREIKVVLDEFKNELEAVIIKEINDTVTEKVGG